MKTFKELGLNHELLKVLDEINFKESTEIQEKVIPLAMEGKDVIGESATGSGKTLAFGASILEKVQHGKGTQALVLTPTRELAEQVSKSLKMFSRNKKFHIVSIYGGVSINPQIDELNRADIVVGTPGRILDHMKRRTIELSKIKFLVLDEADRMLDMGFIHDVTDIIDRCPKERQTFLFSATISEDILRIARHYMLQPVHVSAETYVDPSKLVQVFYDVSSREKFSLLVHLLKEEHSRLVMVFCNTKRNADVIGNSLQRFGFNTLTLHGDINQNKRNRILETLHRSDKVILVCTDVAARGLDIKNVSHVYNYDSPKTSTEYIHRIGRTARAGKEGKAITILSERDYENFRRVSSDPSIKIENIQLPRFEKVFVKMTEERFDHHRRGFSRGQRGGDRGGRFDRRNRSRFGDRGGRSEGRRGDRGGRFGERRNSNSRREFRRSGRR